MEQKKIGTTGIALCGLGYYATEQLAPAFAFTEHCYLSAVITGDRVKSAFYKEKYGLTDRQIYTYDQFEQISYDSSIDIVYIVLPHNLHATYTIKALEAGKHVICEKPMASTVEEAEQMMAVAERTGKTISIGYRLHFDPYHREMIRMVQEQTLGKVTRIDCSFSFVHQPKFLTFCTSLKVLDQRLLIFYLDRLF